MNTYQKRLLAGIAASAFLFSPTVFGAPETATVDRPQTYTQAAQAKTPVLLKGSEREKAKLAQLYQNLGRSETGQSILRQMDEIYERTGTRLPLSFAPMDPSCGGRYVSVTAGVILNSARADSVDEIILAHELKHYIQENRPKNIYQMAYGSFRDAFVCLKAMELETRVQDTVMADELNKTNAAIAAYVPIYRRLKKEGADRFKDNDVQINRYARTELAKILWENKNMPLSEIPFNLFSRNEIGESYQAVDFWNKEYNNTTTGNMTVTAANCPFLAENPQAKENATQVLQAYIDGMDIDVTPDYFRESFSVPKLSDNRFQFETFNGETVQMTLSRNEADQSHVRVTINDRPIIENVFAKDGSCLSALTYDTQTFNLSQKGRLSFGLDEIHYKDGHITEVRKTTGERLVKKADTPRTTLVQTLKSHATEVAPSSNQSKSAPATVFVKNTLTSKDR